MIQKHIKNNSSELIIVLNGWGTDETPFSALTSHSDVLILSNYTDLNIDFDFSKYNNIKSISFSCGVLMTTILKNTLPKIDYSVAINGTTLLFNKDFGVSPEIEKIFTSLNLENYIEFREKYLVFDKKELELFNKYSPRRTFEDSFEEYFHLKKYDLLPKNEFNFDKVLISDCDRIIPAQNQINYWKDKYKIIPNSGHFPFFKFNSFEEIIEY